MMHDYWNYGGSHDWLGGMFMLALTIVLIIGLVYFVRYLNRTDSHPAPGDEAVAILKARYAKGEIDKEEYTQKLKDLNS